MVVDNQNKSYKDRDDYLKLAKQAGSSPTAMSQQ